MSEEKLNPNRPAEPLKMEPMPPPSALYIVDRDGQNLVRLTNASGGPDTNNNYQPSSSFPFDLYSDTDRWYSVEYSPAFGWRLIVTDARNNNPTTVSSAARVILQNNTMTLIVPKGEFLVPNPTYRVTSYQHTGDFGRTNPWSGDLHPPVGEPLNEFGDSLQ